MSLKFRDAETVLEEDDYREMNSVNELKNTLEKETGKEFSTEEAYQKASEEWWRLKRKFIEPETPDKLPSDCVNVAGTDFHVHGIVHDPTLVKYANSQMTSENVPEYLMSKVDEWENERKHTYLEENLLEMLFRRGNPSKNVYHNTEDIGDQEAFSDKVDIEIETEKLSKTESLKTRLKSRFEQKFAGILSKLAKKAESQEEPHNPRLDRFATLQMAARSPDYMKDLQNAERAANLPLQLEYSHGLENNHYRLFNAERSIYQANYAVSDALNHPGQEAHLVVGAAHHPQVVDRLKTLSDRWDIHQLEPEWDTSLEEKK